VSPDVPIHDLRSSRVRYALPALLRLVWKLRPHVVLATLRELNLALLIVKPLLPRGVGLIVREGISVSADLAQDSQYPGLLRWLYLHYYARADRIICVANFIRNDLAEHFGIPLAKMVVIYNPMDVERVRHLADAGENPLADPGPHLVAAGRLWKQKGFDVLLDALALVRNLLPVKLTILGEGPLEVDLKAQSERLGLSGAVRFVGFQPNPYPYLKHADLFVLSSRYEGMPSVILEALSVGTPVVATDCPGGVREILTGSRMGRMVPSSNPRLLAEAIVSAIESKKEKPSKTQDLEALLEKFGVERVTAQYEDLL